MLLLTVATAAVGSSSFILTLAMGLRRTVDVLTAWLVVLSAEIAMAVLAVGLAHQLRPIPLAGTAIGWSVLQVLFAASRWQTVQRSAARMWHAAAATLRSLWRHPVLLALGLLVGVQYAWRLAVALRLPVVDWDGNSYHLISVDTWVQNAAVTHTPQVVYADTYPQNSELVTAWAATFLHNTSLSGLTQFLFAAIGTFAVVGLAKNAGATAPRALLAGLVFAATPIVFLQVGTGYVDIAASATMLAAWQLLLSLYDFRDDRAALVRYLTVSGVAVGMMVGTKTSNLIPAGAAVAVAVCILASAWQRKRAETPSVTSLVPPRDVPIAPVRGGTSVLTAPAPTLAPAAPRAVTFRRYAALPLCALLIPAVAIGSFWYLRNLVTYGNPVWPVTMPFFRGPLTASDLINGNVPAQLAESPPLTQIARSWVEDVYPHDFVYDQRLGGFGPQWILLMVPAIAVMVFGFLRDRVLYLVGLLLPFAVLLLLGLAPWWSRYTLFVVGLGAICYALAVQFLAARWERLLNVGLVALVAVAMWWATSPMYIAAGTPMHPLTPAETWQLIRADHHTRMSTAYPWMGYQPLAKLPHGAVVAAPNNTLIFTHPYVGTDLDRRLVTIDVPKDLDDLHASLLRTGATYVVLSPTSSRTAKLARAAQHDPRFAEVGRTLDGLLFRTG